MTLEEIRARLPGAGFQDVTGQMEGRRGRGNPRWGSQVLFEVRSATLRRQPGEVCFPGAAISRGEEPTACALRETWEGALGIPPEGVEVLAPLEKASTRAAF